MLAGIFTNHTKRTKKSKKTRLVHLVTDLPYGAMGSHTYTIVKALNKVRFEVQVWCLYEEGPFTEAIKQLGVCVKLMLRPHIAQLLSILHRLYLNDRYPPAFKKILFRLTNILRHLCAFISFFISVLTWRPHIIHSFNFYPNTSNRLMAMVGLVPVAITTVTNTTKHNYTTFQSLVARFLAPFSSKIIAMSEAMKSSLVEHEKISLQRIEVVPTAIDLDDLPQTTRINNMMNPATVGIVATIEPRKGHKYFLEAAAIVAKEEPTAKFIIAGDGPLRFQMEQFAQQLGISDRVRFTGHFGHISEIMSQIDIFALSSITDGLPATIMEAMVYGKPVVATNVDGIPEEVVNGQTGFLVPARDPAAMAAAILRLLENSQLATKMGDNGRQFVKRFSAETIVKRLEQIYERYLMEQIVIRLYFLR